MNFVGKAKRLEDIDIPRIGSIIGVGEDELHAFMDVEASGSGFDSKGRPKMLFEPHVFYRNLSGSQRDRAVRNGLAYPKWGTKPYPKDSYPRLKRAMEISKETALRSASWGLGQILGVNYALVGYSSAQAMVRDFMEDEETHLEAIVRYLIATGIDDDLRAHRWRTVARVYNGPGYAKHNYHGRMATRFAWWRRVPDTPWNGDDIEPQTLRRGHDGVEVRDLQLSLTKLNYPVGNADGKYGPKTEHAVKQFQGDNGIPVTGLADPDTLALIDAEVDALNLNPSKPAPDPNPAPENDWSGFWTAFLKLFGAKQ